MKRVGQRAASAAVLAAVIGLSGNGAVIAAENAAEQPDSRVRIRLRDGQEFSGVILQNHGSQLAILVPRNEIESVDGTPLPPPVIPGTAAPAFSAQDLNGQTQEVPRKGSKATLLQFWASWCPYCRKDVQSVQRWSQEYAERGLNLVTVSIDQDIAKLQSFLQQEKVTFPVIATAYPPEDPRTRLPSKYEMQGVPMYVLMDAEGKIVSMNSGSITDTGMDMEGLIEKLLGSDKLRPSAAKAEP